MDYYSAELYHHGIKGMKWGVRRYQNRDGSLTPEGKKRYDRMSDDAKLNYDLKRKNVSELSNAELKKMNERDRLEQEHDKLNPGAVKRGWAYVGAAVGIMGTSIAFYNNSNTIIGIGKKAVNAIKNKR